MGLFISNMIFNILESCIILILFTFINQLKGFVHKNTLKSIIFIFLYAIILTFTDYMIPQAIKAVFNLLFLTLLLAFITQTSFFASLIANALICVYLFTTEIIIMLIFMLVLKQSFESVLSTLPIRIIYGITAKGLELLLASLISNSSIKIKKLSEFRKPNALFQLLALQTLLIVILEMCFNFASVSKSNMIFYNAFIITIYLLFLALNLIDFKERERLQAIQSRSKLQEEYINNIENILNIIRREKHDFSNHLNTILAMCTLNKPDTVLKIGNYIRKLSSVSLVNAYHFYNTGNDYVDGMLAVKSNFAFEHGMNLEADIKAPLNNISINDCDITSIIGNIVDNACDAIIAAGDSEGKTISVSTFEDNECYCLSISNNGPVIGEKDMGRIFDSGYSTKSNEKPDHGFGLYIVQQLVHKYNGIITVTSTKEKTEFLIKINKEAKAHGKVG